MTAIMNQINECEKKGRAYIFLMISIVNYAIISNPFNVFINFNYFLSSVVTSIILSFIVSVIIWLAFRKRKN